MINLKWRNSSNFKTMVNLVISEQELWKVKSNKRSEGNNKEEITFRNEAYLLFLLFPYGFLWRQSWSPC